MAEGSRLTPAIRGAALGDAAEIARLSAQLGYPAPVEAFQARLHKLLQSPQHAAFVADAGEGRLAGFIAVEHRLIIEYGERAEIAALVVDAETRRGGVGRALVAQAERGSPHSACTTWRCARTRRAWNRIRSTKVWATNAPRPSTRIAKPCSEA